MNTKRLFTIGGVCLALLGLATMFFFIGGGVGQTTEIVIDTSMGKITAELYVDKAPITVKNFLRYVDDKAYDGTIFHRVIANFMIQGGGFTPELEERKEKFPPITNESTNGLKNLRGTLAMARNNKPDSATNQFFINVVDNEGLDRAKAKDGVGYCVFGKVTGGMDVVDKIRRVKTSGADGSRFEDLPLEPPIILSIRRAQSST